MLDRFREVSCARVYEVGKNLAEAGAYLQSELLKHDRKGIYLCLTVRPPRYLDQRWHVSFELQKQMVPWGKMDAVV